MEPRTMTHKVSLDTPIFYKGKKGNPSIRIIRINIRELYSFIEEPIWGDGIIPTPNDVKCVTNLIKRIQKN